MVMTLLPMGNAFMANLLTGPATDNSTDLKTLLLAQKSELVGELTRAMANQFNNTMMAVTSYAELEIKRLPPNERKSLEQILHSAGRATALVQKLLGISRNQAGTPQPLNLNSVLADIKHLIEQLSGERVSVVYNLDQTIPPVNADPTQIEQLVLSLAINARNAMAKVGTVTISTRLQPMTADSAGETEHAVDYVMLSVDDTGCGAAAESTERGIGSDQDSRVSMSLAAIRAVVKHADGIPRFSSEPGKGSSFKVYFPALHQDIKAEAAHSTPRKVAVARTVLLVEDDDAVRVPTSELLKMEGFKVLQARTGEEAIHFAQQHKSALDVLITDIVMPSMSGHEVAKTLLELHPGLKVLFISGASEEARSSHDSELSHAARLRKPFRLDALKDKIHELLGE